MGIFVAVNEIEKVFPLRQNGEFIAVDRLDLEIQTGEFVSLMGHSEGEKLNLLKAITGLNLPTNSIVTLAGKRCIFVHHDNSLITGKTVYKTIALAVDINMKELSPKDRKATVEKYINLLGLHSVIQKYPQQLSQEMKQRLAIARVLTTRPQLLLLDEPFKTFDIQTRKRLQKQLMKISQEFSITVIMVTQNVDEAVFLSDRITVLGNIPNISILSSSPGTKIKRILEVNIPRPRKQQQTREHPNYYRLRSEITGLLNQQKQSENLQARKPTQMLSLSIKKNVNLGRMSPSLI